MVDILITEIKQGTTDDLRQYLAEYQGNRCVGKESSRCKSGFKF